jgi:hypothetical protein
MDGLRQEAYYQVPYNPPTKKKKTPKHLEYSNLHLNLNLTWAKEFAGKEDR